MTKKFNCPEEMECDFRCDMCLADLRETGCRCYSPDDKPPYRKMKLCPRCARVMRGKGYYLPFFNEDTGQSYFFYINKKGETHLYDLTGPLE